MLTLLAELVERDPSCRVLVEQHWPGCSQPEVKRRREDGQQQQQQEEVVVLEETYERCLDTTVLIRNAPSVYVAHAGGDHHAMAVATFPLPNVSTTPTSAVGNAGWKYKGNRKPRMRIVTTTTTTAAAATPHSSSMPMKDGVDMNHRRRHHHGVPNVIINYGRRSFSHPTMYGGEGFTEHVSTIIQQSQALAHKQPESLIAQQLIPTLSTVGGQSHSNNTRFTLGSDVFNNASGIGVVGGPLNVLISSGSMSPCSNGEALGSTGTLVNPTIGPLSPASTEVTKKTMMEDDSVMISTAKRISTPSHSIFFKACFGRQIKVKDCHSMNTIAKVDPIPSASPLLSASGEKPEEVKCTFTQPPSPFLYDAVAVVSSPQNVCGHGERVINGAAPNVSVPTTVNDSRAYDLRQHWLHDGYHNDQEAFDALAMTATSSLLEGEDTVGWTSPQQNNPVRNTMCFTQTAKPTQQDSFYAGNPIPSRKPLYEVGSFMCHVGMQRRECRTAIPFSYTASCQPWHSHTVRVGVHLPYCGGHTNAFNGQRNYQEPTTPHRPYPHQHYPWYHYQPKYCLPHVRATHVPEVPPLNTQEWWGQHVLGETSKFKHVEAWLAEVDIAMRS